MRLLQADGRAHALSELLEQRADALDPAVLVVPRGWSTHETLEAFRDAVAALEAGTAKHDHAVCCNVWTHHDDTWTRVHLVYARRTRELFVVHAFDPTLIAVMQL